MSKPEHPLAVFALGAFLALVYKLLEPWIFGPPTLNVATWNLAAVNENPFEYWVNHDDPAYMQLMGAVQDRFDDPGEADILVGQVFTQDMYDELEQWMQKEGWHGLEETRQRWSDDLSKRRIITEFLKDKSLGDKRLISMPDRMTNSVTLPGGGKAFRPTPVSAFDDGKLSSVAEWWPKFRAFLFDLKEPDVFQEVDTHSTVRVVELLEKIPRKKYPALTEDEENISLSLQTVCLALFDAVLVHTVNDVADQRGIDWHALKNGLTEVLVKGKVKRTIDIIANRSEDILFLQEVAGTFPKEASGHRGLAKKFHILKPSIFDVNRNQHSIILVSKKKFYKKMKSTDQSKEAADRARALGAEIADGDLFCTLIAGTKEIQSLLLASFHGDTNGLMTVPVVEAVFDTWRAAGGGDAGGPSLIMGLDGNTHHAHTKKKQGVHEFFESITAVSSRDTSNLQIRSVVHGRAVNTSYNMRTALQPQLQKAVRLAEMESSPLVDRNPKDHIIYVPEEWSPVENTLQRDNIGNGSFNEGIMPSLVWPSDHALMSVRLARTSMYGAR